MDVNVASRPRLGSRLRLQQLEAREVPAGVADIAGNLIANPSLELANSASPANWRTLKPSSMRATFSYSTPGFVGNRSASIDVRRVTGSQDAQWYFNDVQVAPNTTYTFSNLYTADVPTSLVVRYLMNNGSFQYSARTSLPAASTPTQTSLQFTTPANVQAVTVFHAISQRGLLRTDEYALVPGVADTTAPTVSLSSPVANAVVSGSITLSATANDNVLVRSVRFAIDGVAIGSAITNAPYQLVVDTRTLSNGNHTVTATADDWAGNSTTSVVTAFTVNNDVTAPTVSVSTPTAGAVLVGTTTLEATAADNDAVKSVQFFVDGVAVGQPVTIAPYRFNFDSKTIADGTHVVTARAEDNAGNRTTSPGVNVTVRNDITAPTVSIVAPIAGSTVSGNIVIDANAQDNLAVTRVTFRVDGVVVGSPVTLAPFRISFDTRTVADGVRSITAIAEDAAGNSTTSAAVLVTVSNTIQPPPTSTNLFANASMESIGTDGLPVGWVRDAWGTSTPQFIFPVAGSDGSNGARVEVSYWTSGDVKWHPVAVPVQAGGLYTFKHSYRSDGETTLVAQFRLPNGTNQYARLATLGGTNAWVSASYLFTVPDQVTSMTVFHVLARVGWLEVDDFSLTTGSNSGEPNPTPNLVPNATLETPGSAGAPLNWARGSWGNNNAQFTYPVAGRTSASAARIDITSYASGDAKWYFSDVAVSAGQTLDFRSYYRSNATTQLVARYTFASGAVDYVLGATLDASATWNLATTTFIIPANVVSMTVFHNLYSTGWLEIDDYSLTRPNTSGSSRGIVSLSFDDGWESHFTSAFPILQQAQLPATFYAVPGHSTETPSDQRIGNPSFEALDGTGKPVGWTSSMTGSLNATFVSANLRRHGARVARIDVGSYVSGEAGWAFDEVPVSPGQQLRLTFDYQSTAPTAVVLKYRRPGGVIVTQELAALPASGTAWQGFNQVLSVPTNVVGLTAYQAVRGNGQLILDDYNLRPVVASGNQSYLDPSQILSLEQYGHEIGAHTRNHESLPSLSAAAALAEIAGSRADLLEMGVAQVDTFAYPYGEYNQAVRQMVADSGFIGGRSVDRGFNTASNDRYTLKIQQVDRTTTREQVQAWVSTAEQSGTWLILMFHQIDYDQSAIYGNAPELLQQIVTDVKAANVDVRTVRDAIQQLAQ